MIYLIITSSIVDKYTKQNTHVREQLYIDSITNTLKLLPSSIKPIIVENNGFRKTLLDEFNIQVFYTNNNSLNLDKAEKELKDIKDTIANFNIQDNDTIIKLTGRYNLLSPYFFNYVIENNKYDVYIKFFNVCTQQYCLYDCVLGMFAIKSKYLKQFNYTKIQKPKVLKFLKSPEPPSWEVQFAMYIKNLNINICQLTKLDLRYYGDPTVHPIQNIDV